MALPLHVPVPDGHEVVALLEAGDHGKAALLHPDEHHRSISSHAEPKALGPVLSQLDAARGSPVVLGREDCLWTKLLEQVTDSVGREVWEGEGELDGGGWENRGRLQQFLEVILLVDLLIEMESSLVALLENLLQSIFLPQFSAHPVHPESLLVGKQGLPQVCFACKPKRSVLAAAGV